MACSDFQNLQGKSPSSAQEPCLGPGERHTWDCSGEGFYVHVGTARIVFTFEGDIYDAKPTRRVLMPRFVTALFDDLTMVERVTEALRRLGVELPNIQTIDEDRQAEGFFDRLFLDENGDGPPEEVQVMGVSRTDADEYSRRVAAGEVLLIAMCEESQYEEARQILSRFGGRQLGESAVAEEEEAESKLAEYPTDTPKWFTVVEVDETDPDRDVREHAVHIHTRSDIHHARMVDFPGAHPSARFEEFETEFRVHYAENFTDSKYSFSDVRLAYIYGMAMAQNPRLKTHDWAEIRDAARRGWRDHSDKPWSIFEEAVHFGWRKIRARQRRQTRR